MSKLRENKQSKLKTQSIKEVCLHCWLACDAGRVKHFIDFIVQNFYNFTIFKVRTRIVQFTRVVFIKPIAIWMFIIFPSIIQANSIALWGQTYQSQKSDFLVWDLRLNKVSNFGFPSSEGINQGQHSNVKVCAGFFQNEFLVDPNGGQVGDKTTQNNADQTDNDFFHSLDPILVFMFCYITAMLSFLLFIELDIQYNFEYQWHRLLEKIKRTS